MEITRRLFLQFFAALPILRFRSKPEQSCGVAFPMYFPDGLDGKSERRSVFLPLVSK